MEGPDAQAYCGRCRIMLDQLLIEGETIWIHPIGRAMDDPSVGGHEPVPVVVGLDSPLLDARTYCDFCDAHSPEWTYPCDSFEVTDGYGSHGDWACCDACSVFIEAGDYTGLTKRCAKDRPVMAMPLGLLYQGFAMHRRGARWRHRPSVAPGTD